MKKILRKNSSLITKLHKGLVVKALECDELHFQLITSEVNGLLRDEYGKQLITTQQAVNQHIKSYCDE